MNDMRVGVDGDVAEFCRAVGGGRAFGWEGLGGLLEWYDRQGTLVVARDGDGKVIGVGMAWRTTEARVRELVRDGRTDFLDEVIADGDALRLGDWACAGRAGLLGLVAEVTARWPDWPRLKIFTGRRGRLARVSHKAIWRLISERRLI
nr:hypothetical protein [uncultured Rhodopila sp.]